LFLKKTGDKSESEGKKSSKRSLKNLKPQGRADNKGGARQKRKRVKKDPFKKRNCDRFTQMRGRGLLGITRWSGKKGGLKK